MGLYQFRLPDIGEGVAEAEITAWHVKPGDAISEDQGLLDVMTDKATVDMSSPVDGTVRAVFGAVGDMVAVGAVLAEIEVEGEGNVDETAAPAPSQTPAAEPKAEPLEPPATKEQPPAKPAPAPAPAKPRKPGAGPFAAPATRRRAHELGIPLQYVEGSGPGGRILPEDLDAYLAGAGRPPARAARSDAVSEEPITGLRRVIAERMEEAKRRISHISYVEEVDVTELEALRAELNVHRGERAPRLTLLPFLIRALAKALPDFPRINAHFDDDARVLRRFEAVHVGIATQTPAGLMVPVLRHAEGMTLDECAREIVRLSAAARDGTAKREELTGSTITITSLGPLGGIVSTPVINRPEVAIIGPNRIVERPVVQDGRIVIRKMMNLSSSFDHRIVDGYEAALFVQALKRMIEHPALLFMEEPE